MDYINKKIGQSVVKAIAFAATGPIAILFSQYDFIKRFNCDHIVLGICELNKIPYTNEIIASALSLVAIFIIYSILALFLSLIDDRNFLTGRYVSVQVGNLDRINIFRINRKFFAFQYYIVGEEFTLHDRWFRTGSWVSKGPIDITIEGNNARILYVYYGESNGEFSGNGYSSLVIRDDGTGNGFWIEENLNMERKNSIYTRLSTRDLYFVLRNNYSFVQSLLRFFFVDNRNFVEMYSSIPNNSEFSRKIRRRDQLS